MNPYFLNKPLIFNAKSAHRIKKVLYTNDGTAILKINKGKIVKIPPDHQYDLTQATMFGLNERLTAAATSPVTNKQGQTLRDEFNAEWERYSEALAVAKDNQLDYGVYVYYPERNDLVRYCDPYWHRIVSVASNSKLLADPSGKLSWKEIRDIFDKTTIAIAGCSVGNSIIHTTVMDVRPGGVKIADKSLYKMENINRVRLGYWDIVFSNGWRRSFSDLLLKNKACVTAEQIYAIDPFVNAYIYAEGVQSDNIQRFFGGAKGEPPADIVIEEADDPRIKILIREEARKRRVPIVMASDLGSAVQVDILRYDQNFKLPLAYGKSDKEVYAGLDAFYKNPNARKSFTNLLDTLIGKDYRQGEFIKILEGRSEIPTSTIAPQIASTVALSGALIAETVARLLLGHNYPRRFLFNKRTLKIKKYR